MPKKTRKQVLLGISLPLLVLAIGAGAGAMIIKSKPVPATSVETELTRNVNTVIASVQELAVSVQSQGTVIPHQQISVMPQVSGELVWVSAKFVNGGHFQTGETILKIDDRDYQLAVTSAQAAVAEASAQLATAQAQSEQAVADWALIGKQANSDLALRKPQLAGAQARLMSAQAELERARLQLSRTSIKAPFDSILSDKQVDLGQYINAGSVLASLVSEDDLEIRLSIPYRDIEKLALNMDMPSISAALSIQLSGLNGATGNWEATLLRSEALIDSRTRNMTLVASVHGQQRFSDNGEVLRIGQFVVATLVKTSTQHVIRLPRTALYKGQAVYVVDEDQRLREKPVEILAMEEEFILLSAGLEAGDVVSISPLTSAAEGQKVLASTLGGKLP